MDNNNNNTGVFAVDQHWAERVEKKLDEMANAITTMARVEEKNANLEIRRMEHHERQNRLSAKVDANQVMIIAIKEKVTLMWSLTILAATSFAGAIFTHYYL